MSERSETLEATHDDDDRKRRLGLRTLICFEYQLMMCNATIWYFPSGLFSVQFIHAYHDNSCALYAPKHWQLLTPFPSYSPLTRISWRFFRRLFFPIFLFCLLLNRSDLDVRCFAVLIPRWFNPTTLRRFFFFS